jgi:hypothetical protein
VCRKVWDQLRSADIDGVKLKGFLPVIQAWSWFRLQSQERLAERRYTVSSSHQKQGTLFIDLSKADLLKY